MGWVGSVLFWGWHPKTTEGKMNEHEIHDGNFV